MQGLRNGLAVWNRDASIDRSDRTILILWSTKDPQKIPHVVVSACFHMMPCFAATIRLKTFATQELPYADISSQPPVKTGHILIWIHLVPISRFPSNCSLVDPSGGPKRRFQSFTSRDNLSSWSLQIVKPRTRRNCCTLSSFVRIL